MSGIIVPQDRTTKQPVHCYCLNPQCRDSNLDVRFEFEAKDGKVACPKCGATHHPMVGLLVLTHYLVSDMRGPITGGMGFRFRLACDATRAYLATATNMEAASGDLTVVNCPGCLAYVQKHGLPQRSGEDLIVKGA